MAVDVAQRAYLDPEAETTSAAPARAGGQAAGLAGDFSDLTIIIPTLNEAESIRSLIEQLARSYPSATCLVVDDASSDGTQDIVRRLSSRTSGLTVSLLDRRNVRHRGITASVLDGISRCETEYFVVIDGDMQHPPEQVEEIVALLRSGTEIVIANRVSLAENLSLFRGLTTRVATIFSRNYLRRRGLQITDPMSGFFGARTKLLKQISSAYFDRFEPRGYKVLFDLLKIVTEPGNRYGVSIAHVFFRFGERPQGYSKLGPRHVLRFLRSLTR